MNRISPILSVGCAVGLIVSTGLAGEKIIFSGRDGLAVSFDFSRQVRLLPPELEETRLGQSAAADPGTFVPLADPSLSPNALRRRKSAPDSESERDWLFQKPGSETSKPRRTNQRSLTDRKDESAMMKYMKGDSAEERDEAATEEESDPQAEGRSERNETPAERRQPLTFRQLTGMADGKTSLMQKIETEAGFGQPTEKEVSLKQFLQSDLRQRDELRHRQSMSDFRQRIVDPFGTAGGINHLGQSPPPGEFGGLLPGPGLGMPGGLTDGGLVPSTINGLGSPGAGSAFEQRGAPARLGAELPFRKEPTRRVRPKPISMDIQKRDF